MRAVRSFYSTYPMDLLQSSLVLLEAAIPAPHTLEQIKSLRDQESQKDLILVDSIVDESAHLENTVNG